MILLALGLIGSQAAVSHHADTQGSLDHLTDRYTDFQTFHNANHRYSALGGTTPNQTELDTGFVAQPPDPDVTTPDGFADLSGRVEYIRLIRSGVTLRLLDLAFPMPDQVVYEYVTAVLDIDDQHFDVLHHDARIARFPCPLPT